MNIVSLALLVSFVATQDPVPLRFKVGDSINILAPQGYGGTFTILSDGAIYGKGWGRVVIAGQSWEDSQRIVRKALEQFVRSSEVFVTVASQKRDLVYVVGLAGNQGPTNWEPGMTLRRLLAGAQFPKDLDQTVVTVYRGDERAFASRMDAVLSSSLGTDPEIKPSDVVAITTIDMMRVWVTGAVKAPGDIRVPVGSDLSRVLAEAGGAQVQNGYESGVEVVLRRGPQIMRYPARLVTELENIPVEAGDDISVVFPEIIKVTVDGKVASPGEYSVTGTGKLSKAIAMAGGIRLDGTLNDVMVVRSGEMHTVDGTLVLQSFELQNGDLVIVKRNERTFYVFGEVNAPGAFKMEDGKEYRLLDALAAAGGLNSRGVMRRVFLSQRAADGKYVVRHVTPDEFLRNGNEEQNPVIKPGDSLLFTATDGLSFAAVSQLLTSLVLIDALGGTSP